MNDFRTHYTAEHHLMKEIRGSELLDFFVDVFKAADRATQQDNTGFNKLINDWLDEFDRATDPVILQD